MRNVLIVLAVFIAGGAGGWFANKYANKPAPVAPKEEPKVEPADEVAMPDHPLETLDWLVGNWVDASDDHTIEVNCHYTKNRAFLLRSFRVSEGDKVTLSGMQIIGWDESLQTIRSWTYDSDGGFGDEIWTQVGTRYTLRSTYTLPDGQHGSALSTLTYLDNDRFTWKSVNREIAGEFQPDVDEFVIVRDTQADVAKKEGN
jgi:hypothetical protein